MGEGSYGRVYLCEDTEAKRFDTAPLVAVKESISIIEDSGRFFACLRELKILRNLSIHPNVSSLASNSF